jgi:hypothetical protein
MEQRTKIVIEDNLALIRRGHAWPSPISTICAAVLLPLACLGLTGCNKGPAGLVPVSGKLTLDGKGWPKYGQINFSPVKTVEGHPVLPAMARINDDGTFAILTPAAPGLVPGEYNIAIRCMLEASDERHAGKSAIPERYGNPRTSGLKVTVAEGSQPIVLNLDLKSK